MKTIEKILKNNRARLCLFGLQKLAVDAVGGVVGALDYEQAGSGAVLCGVAESKDPTHGTRAVVTGLSRTELESLKDKVFELSRSLVTPPIAPRFDTVELDNAKSVLVTWTSAISDVHSVGEDGEDLQDLFAVAGGLPADGFAGDVGLGLAGWRVALAFEGEAPAQVNQERDGIDDPELWHEAQDPGGNFKQVLVSCDEVFGAARARQVQVGFILWVSSEAEDVRHLGCQNGDMPNPRQKLGDELESEGRELGANSRPAQNPLNLGDDLFTDDEFDQTLFR